MERVTRVARVDVTRGGRVQGLTSLEGMPVQADMAELYLQVPRGAGARAA